MKNVRLIFAFTAILIMSTGNILRAQQPGAAETKRPVRTPEQIAAEEKAREEQRKNDWPNLARYRNENAKLGKPAPGEKRVVFMGNSITEGWIRTSPEFFSGRPYIDRGISAQTTPQMLLRFRDDVIDLGAMVVVILAGTNDIAGNTGPSTQEMIQDNIRSMVDLSGANGIKVVLCSVLPAYDYWWSPGKEPAKKIVALNEWIRDFALKSDIPYVDFFTPMVDERLGLKAQFSPDGVHPNKDGYKIMEPLVEKAIEEVLK